MADSAIARQAVTEGLATKHELRAIADGQRGRHRTVEQRAGRGPHQQIENLRRQMYGRAGVDLLRARLLPLPVLATR